MSVESQVEFSLPDANSCFERTSLVFESVLAGFLVHWQPRWPPNVRLVTNPESPWFPTAFGWLGSSTSTRVTRATSLLTRDKVRTQELLEANAVPTPQSKVFPPGAYSDAHLFAAEIGWPLVVKPREGGQCQGVSVDVESEAHLRLAFERLEEAGFDASEFLVQRSVPGEAYRILASLDRVYGANYKLPAHVVGDGRSTVEQLIAMKNYHRRRNPPPRHSWAGNPSQR